VAIVLRIKEFPEALYLILFMLKLDFVSHELTSNAPKVGLI